LIDRGSRRGARQRGGGGLPAASQALKGGQIGLRRRVAGRQSERFAQGGFGAVDVALPEARDTAQHPWVGDVRR